VEPLHDDNNVGCVPASSSSHGFGAEFLSRGGLCVPIVTGVKLCLRVVDRPKFVNGFEKDMVPRGTSYDGSRFEVQQS